MCGRYAFIPQKDFYDRFEITNREQLVTAVPQCTPGQQLPVIIKNSPKKLVYMRWGIKPAWVSEGKTIPELINARAEGINKKITFKNAFLNSRCLIPVSGFFEWKVDDKTKTPYFFARKDSGNFCLAGIYENNCFSIITTSPNELIAPIHNRMPVILDRDEEDVWLDKNRETGSLLSLLDPAEKGGLTVKLFGS